MRLSDTVRNASQNGLSVGLTEIARCVALDRVIVRCVKVIEDNIGVRGNRIGLFCQCGPDPSGRDLTLTHIDVIHEIHAHRQVNPGGLVDHRGSITRALHDLQLIRRSDTTLSALAQSMRQKKTKPKSKKQKARTSHQDPGRTERPRRKNDTARLRRDVDDALVSAVQEGLHLHASDMSVSRPDHALDGRVHPELKVVPLTGRHKIRRQRAAALAVREHVRRMAVGMVLRRWVVVQRQFLPAGRLQAARDDTVALLHIDLSVGGRTNSPRNAVEDPVCRGDHVLRLPARGEIVGPVEGIWLFVCCPLLNDDLFTTEEKTNQLMDCHVDVYSCLSL